MRHPQHAAAHPGIADPRMERRFPGWGHPGDAATILGSVILRMGRAMLGMRRYPGDGCDHLSMRRPLAFLQMNDFNS